MLCEAELTRQDHWQAQAAEKERATMVRALESAEGARLSAGLQVLETLRCAATRGLP